MPAPSTVAAGGDSGGSESPAPQAAQPPVNVWDAQPQEPAVAANGEAVAGSPGARIDMPFGVPVGRAGRGMDDFAGQFKRRLQHTHSLYRPHMVPLALLVGLVTVPFAVLEVVLRMMPGGGFFAVPLALVQSALALFYVEGVLSEYANRVQLGQSVTIAQASAAHLQRLVPWVLTMLLTVVVCLLACCLLVVPAIMLGWAVAPALVVEGRQLVDAPRRSLELFTADWRHVSQGLSIPVLALILLWMAHGLLASLPEVRRLAPVAVAVAEAFVVPAVTIYSFGLFYETRQRVLNAQGS